jgi:cytochrome c oxidase cbb3-type subunit III
LEVNESTPVGSLVAFILSYRYRSSFVGRSGSSIDMKTSNRSFWVAVLMLAMAEALGQSQSQAPSENGSASAQKQEGQRALRTREFLGLGRQPDPQLASDGERIFGPTCSFCHGADARGALGPDLLRSPLVLDDDHGESMGPMIQNGSPNKGMPAFPSLSEAQVRAIAEFLHMQVELAANRGTYQVRNILTGNAQAGKAYFQGEGKCYTCHSVTGDLAHIGSKLDPVDLQAVELYPEARSYDFGGKRPPRQVTVTLADGKKLTGSLSHLDDFYVSLEDDRGQYHTIAITKGVKAVVEDKLEFHRKMLDHYTDKQIHDLTAYLVTLK